MSNVASVMTMTFGESYEFWKSATEDAFREAATDLLRHGYRNEDAASLLGSLHSAVSDEYGA